MPSPVSHLSAGLAIHEAVRRRFPETAGKWQRLLFFCVVMGLSILPDCDAALGILLHDFGRFHNNLTHGLLAGCVAGGIAGILAHLIRRQSAGRWAALGAGCYLLHVIMDYFTVGRGVMLFWPSTVRYEAPIKLFFGLHWSEGWISPMHWITLLNELPFAILVLLLAWRTRRGEAG